MKLVDKVVLITGGGRGIGKAIALALADEGADVALLARTSEQINAVAETVREMGRRGLAITCDVTRPAAVSEALEQLNLTFGRLHVLINNAGGGQERRRVGSDDPREWQNVIAVNLLGVYHVTRAALPLLKKSGGGSIINIGSGMGHQPRPGNSSYHVAKAAAWMFTRCLSEELWDDGIAVNEFIPGPVYTDLTSGILNQDSAHPAIPSEWVKNPRDVAPLAVFLASQGTHGPTGQSFSLARRPL